MTNEAQPQFMMFRIPKDAAILESLGRISLLHGHLDHMLRMTIKSIAGVEVEDAVDATIYEGSSSLRQRIRRLARARLGDGPALIRLQAILTRAKHATEKRNELLHSVWAGPAHDDGDAQLRTAERTWKPMPTVDELRTLEAELASVTAELNDARLEGFLAQAMKSRPPPSEWDSPPA